MVREPVPVHQNVILRDAEEARALNRGRLALHACGGCGFVFNTDFDPALLSYDATYDNTQSCSPVFEEYVDHLADEVAAALPDGARCVVEIGCGKGGFLRALARRHPSMAAIGFDPSYVGEPIGADGRVRFERRFYDHTCHKVKADAVVCRHVIEHVPDPLSLLRLVRETADRVDAVVFFETPCVEWILSNEVVWDVFYEHCSYFSAGSLRSAFERARFTVASVRHTFGGQYLWLTARPADGPIEPIPDGGRLLALGRGFGQMEAARVAAVRERLEGLGRLGAVALWGAGAKGVTLANLVDPHGRLLACVVDLNPNKQGGYLPGTGHPIVAPDELRRWKVRTAVLTNPNYISENTRLLQAAGIDVRLVDLMQDGDADANSY